jgi:hypothetical protein
MMTNQIQARLEAVNTDTSSFTDIAVRVYLHNLGTKSVSIPAQALNSPSLLFELIDENGAKVPFPPPPVPDPRAGNISITADQTWQAYYVGFLPDPTPGTYQLRVSLRGDINIVSNWLTIRLL